MPKELNKTD